MPSNHLTLWNPLLFLPSILPSRKCQGLFQWVGCSHRVTKILELQLQPQSFQWVFRDSFSYDWLFWSPCCSRDSQESSPAPQCEGISSLALCLLLFYVCINFPYGSSSKEFTSNTGKTELWVQFLGQEDLLEEEMAIHSSTLAWKIPWTEEPDRLTVHGVRKSWIWLGTQAWWCRNTHTHTHTHMHTQRNFAICVVCKRSNTD